MTGRCILIIEDHPASRTALKEMIERRGGQTECAHSLREGTIAERIRREEGRPFDCVVSDIGLPNCTVREVLETLKGFRSHDIPVRAITGINDKEIVEQCAEWNIPVILKGTSAEGIMESILYALAENPRNNLKDVAKAIVENREIVREVPAHTSWFFVTWPKWAQALASLGTLAGILTTISTFSIAFIKSVDAKAIARETVKQSTDAYQTKVDNNATQLTLQGGFIRSLQDSRIETNTMLSNLSKTAARIEDKVDGILRNDAKVDALWKQRVERKNNADLSGGTDAPEGPVPPKS